MGGGVSNTEGRNFLFFLTSSLTLYKRVWFTDVMRVGVLMEFKTPSVRVMEFKTPFVGNKKDMVVI